jgi:hypothetical protein
MVEADSSLIASRSQFTLKALGTSTAFVLSICAFLEPQWQSNDDVALSMVAHGYGLNAVSSPNLIFSNVLWGMLVQAMPWVGDTPGYSIATLGVLVLIGTVILVALAHSRVGALYSAGLLILVLTRPVLFPQFTINAGLLCAAAIASVLAYAQGAGRRSLILACVLAFLSFLIRSLEFFLVILVAIPLIPWRQLADDKIARIAMMSVTLAVLGAALTDKLAFKDERWQVFNQLDPVRAQFTDFGAAGFLMSSPEIIKHHGYSWNDIYLIKHWFFADPQLVNPQKLQLMLDELGPLAYQAESLSKAMAGLRALFHPHLLPLTLVSLLILVFRPSRRVAAAWIISLCLFFGLGLAGRPGVIRVYIPVLTLLLLAPLLGNQFRGNGETIRFRTQRVLSTMLVIATLWNTYIVASESQTLRLRYDKVRNDLNNFPTEPVVIWGSSFPFEAVYRVLTVKPDARNYKLYGLGVTTWAPYSYAAIEHEAGRGVIERIASPDGIPIVASTEAFKSLATYCDEHRHGVLQETKRETFGRVAVSWRRCGPASPKVAEVTDRAPAFKYGKGRR